MATTVAVGILALEGFGLYCEVKAFYDYTQDGDEEALFKGVALGFLFLGAGKVLEKGFRALKGIKGIKTRLPRTKGSRKGKPGEETLKTDAFSAYNWDKFGFKTIDRGNEYIYDIKDIRKENTTASNFIKTLWKTLQVTNDEVLDIFELNAAYKTLETQHEVAKIVCKHKSEWAYKPQEIADEITKFYDFLIAEEKPEVKADLEKLKKEKLEGIKEQVENLMFRQEASALQYTAPVKEEEQTPKPKFDIGVDQNYALTPNTADSTATTPTTETETETKPKQKTNYQNVCFLKLI